MFMEKGTSRNTILQAVSNVLPKSVEKLIGWFYTKMFLSFALVGFELYYYDRIMYVYGSIYFICPVLSLLVIATNAIFVQKIASEKDE